ncbi:CDP-alcohol phosphatidyltransferase family protein [Enterocloster clostridioformis]|uniref:CDP-diacylglycerol--glycerol-3-phosphate 3-phosphatidyltransferase n=1 Tax=Enterocloster clostridioformis TaxID=1531 RepID=A0A1I0JDL9_9FIRM|nr:CDP-alcohol phosphatidyltransferase family protein [Enterocloster clostridioformis]SEU08157.1 CDP-diacylglycerol--glycerol-3-phosphate 3-phosphatidyltransferase [Enterocloster clostridioformis]SEW45353.1 CDP-diacylglycerol--glycerol-3-phosphate 3-phosphatidyltransferase [Enterocloster clostridioformis]
MSRKCVANLVTILRILLSLLLLCSAVFSSAFYAIYLICGFTDMADGWIARRMHSES